MPDERTSLVAVVEIECERVARIRGRHGERFLRRAFTDDERARCLSRRDADASLAARLAARIGLAALCRRVGVRAPAGCGDAAVVPDASGAPTLRLSDELARALSGWSIDVSLAHDGGWAAAAVMAQPCR
jgi:holo-[acyl-carrier protein] synthase